jgi:hypothetical protein
MIQKFNQFITESNNRSNAFSVHEEINEPISLFFDRAFTRLDTYKEVMEEVTTEMDKVIEEAMTGEFEDHIVGQPVIEVEDDLSEVVAIIDTDIPNNDEAWETDESPAIKLEQYLWRWFDDTRHVKVEIGGQPNEDGNCVIKIKAYLIDEDICEEHTDALKSLGRDW